MLRRLLLLFTTALIFIWLSAVSAYADDYAFDVQGRDYARGSYSGELTLTERPTAGEFDAVRTVRYANGTALVQRGVLRKGYADKLRGVLCESVGAAGRLECQSAESVWVILRIDDNTDRCFGSFFGSQSAGRFRGTLDTTVTPGPAPLPPHTQPPSGEKFNGKDIYDFDPAIGITDADGAYRISSDDDPDAFQDALDKLLADPGIDRIDTLVIGYWSYDGSSKKAVEKIVANKAKLQNIKAVFFGDIDQEEAEISWIENTDLGPLVDALPNLELLKTRGGGGLGFSSAGHAKLKEIIIESGGTDSAAIRGIANASLPALERAELWLGTDEYGADSTVDDVRGFFSGNNHPKLKSLGLMNSDISDAIAIAIANAPILDQLTSLDLSMGTLSDAGAQALMASDKVKNLSYLNLDHHYMSDPVRDQIEALSPVNVNAGSSELDPAYPDDRYVAVGE